MLSPLLHHSPRQPFIGRTPIAKYQLPCPRLCHDKACFQPPGTCKLSHDKSVIEAWKAGPGRKPCHWGARCTNARQYRCARWHPENELVPEPEREQKAYQNLVKLGSISLEALSGPEDASVTDLKGISSFSTLDQDDEIAVPGAPAFFEKPQRPFTLPFDGINRALHAPPKLTHSLEALVASVQRMGNSSDLWSANVVASCGALRKIFGFMTSAFEEPGRTVSDRFPPDLEWLPHRLDLEWRAPGTLYISPWAGDPRFEISAGLGRGFEDMSRRFDQSDPVIRRSFSHHQVVSYNLGGLRCIVQAEVDAFSCDCSHSSDTRHKSVNKAHREPSMDFLAPGACVSGAGHTQKAKCNGPRSKEQKKGKVSRGSQAGLASVFSVLAMDDPGDSRTEKSHAAAELAQRAASGKLTVHMAGDCRPSIPISCLVEIKTKKKGSPVDFMTWAPQLYFSGRRQLYSAVHHNRIFDPRDGGFVEGLDSKLEDWAHHGSTQAALSRTVALISGIRNMLADLTRSGEISLGPDGHGLSLLLGYDQAGEEVGKGATKKPFARLYSRADGVRLLP